MSDWLPSALAYVDSWLSHYMRVTEQPGCCVAVLHDGAVAMERAYGSADLDGGRPMTTRHRFRVASQSKAFTAAGIMLLREAGRLRLDDAVGAHVPDLNTSLVEVTIGQLLSHSAGIVRDGADCGRWNDARPWPDAAGLLTVTSPEAGRTTAADGFGSFGDPVRRRVADDGGAVLWLAGEEYWPEDAIVASAREADERGAVMPSHSGCRPVAGALPTSAFRDAVRPRGSRGEWHARRRAD